jgi:hypothetical protein
MDEYDNEVVKTHDDKQIREICLAKISTSGSYFSDLAGDIYVRERTANRQGQAGFLYDNQGFAYKHFLSADQKDTNRFYRKNYELIDRAKSAAYISSLERILDQEYNRLQNQPLPENKDDHVPFLDLSLMDLE